MSPLLAEKFDVFLFDLDGVIYIGGELLPGVKETMAQLRNQNKGIYFLTNDPVPTRQQLVERLQGLGIEAQLDEVISSGWATAKTLRVMNIRSVYVLGSEGLKTEMREFGIAVAEKEDCQAVVVGHDDQLSYSHMRQAIQLIHRGATFIATNADATFPGPAGPCPGTGSIVRALETSSGRRPVIIGKPYPPMFRTVLDHLDCDLRVAMVGDNPYTDILGAHQQGIPAILRSDRAVDFPSPRDFRIPDARISSLKELFEPTITLRSWAKPPYAWPETVEPAVAAVIFDGNGRILLIKRVDFSAWGLPTGHIEPGETVQEAIIREVGEETGLQVKVRRYIGVYSNPASMVVSHPSGKVSHYITSCMECQMIGGHVRADGVETAEVAFFELDNLPTNLLTLHVEWLKDALDRNNAGVIR
ncbi:MAG: HAD-IIA family hydrolase [Bacillota bacterium]